MFIVFLVRLIAPLTDICSAYLPKDYSSKRDAGDTAKLEQEYSSCMMSLCWPESMSDALETMTLDQRWEAIARVYSDWSPKQ